MALFALFERFLGAFSLSDIGVDCDESAAIQRSAMNLQRGTVRAGAFEAVGLEPFRTGDAVTHQFIHITFPVLAA